MTARPEIVCMRSKLLSYFNARSIRVKIMSMQIHLRGLKVAVALVLLKLNDLCGCFCTVCVIKAFEYL